ncbi:MAG: glycosyl transferase family 28 [Parabacteroides sp.]|nr:glycosyl transferase family 28 [Parabacteroides sp.]
MEQLCKIMIFVTLGTQKIPFVRLLSAVDELIESEHITEEVVAQTGHTEYTPRNFKNVKFLDEATFQEMISKSSVIIAHAGSGALFNALKWHKKIIACARLYKYGEMIDDHQTELTRKLTQEGYILDGTYSLTEAWKKLPDFRPRKNNFSCTISELIHEMIKKGM